MPISPFHAYYKARELSNLAHGNDKLVPVFSSSNIEIYPYQIAAALFALRSPYLKGVILSDDGSLGKSIEAMMVITEKWYEGKQRILIVVPTPLLYQWSEIVESHFSIPLVTMDSGTVFKEQQRNGNLNPFLQDAVIITTYDFAAEHADDISQIHWAVTVFDEAHHLRRIYTGENKGAMVIREAVTDSFKLLLTATPMQNDIMDLYGLIYFIDDTALPDADSFYKRYFRRPENYEELAMRVSRFCYRTTRAQVSTYIKIPERIPITVEFSLTVEEQSVAGMLNEYLGRNIKYAFPKMELYDLTLMLFRNLSSSSFALLKTLRGVEWRLVGMANDHNNPAIKEELAFIRRMVHTLESIKINAKGVELINALKKYFTETKQLGANKKALIFTENRATQNYLFELLNVGEYKGVVLTFNGDSSRDYTIIERFKNEAVILIATDIACEGFGLEFCSFVINYDLPYNTLKIEQRINRCHRQGQQSDVIVLNFLNRNNFADVRMLELINKHILQFDGIIGLSDDVIGHFGSDALNNFEEIFATARSKNELNETFDGILEVYTERNKKLVKTAEQSLFTSFKQDIAENVTITPQYMKQRTEQVNDDLWKITKYFFEGKQGYHCEDDTRTLQIGIQPQKVFTGAHLGRREYSIDDRSLPKSGWHTLTGTLARNMFAEIFWKGIPDNGTVVVDSLIENCSIAYYQIGVKTTNDYFSAWQYYVLIGKTRSGRILTHDECADLMALPVIRFTKSSEIYGDRDGLTNPKRPEAFDKLVCPEEYIKRTLDEMDGVTKEEMRNLKAHTLDMKISIGRNIEALQSEVKMIEYSLTHTDSLPVRVKNEKQKVAKQKELRQSEQQFFMDSMRLEAELEERIKQMMEQANFTAAVKRQFIIQMMSNQ